MIDKGQQKKEFDQTKFVFCIQSAFDIHYSKGSSENIWDNQSSKCQETGLKRKKISVDILYLQLYFHITNDISGKINKIVTGIIFTF